MPPPTIPGAIIRAARREIGLSQEEVAAKMRKAGANWSAITVSDIERHNGRRALLADEVRALAAILGIQAYDLLAEKPEGRTPRWTRRKNKENGALG